MLELQKVSSPVCLSTSPSILKIKVQETVEAKLFWARMSGFSPWPARLCSAYEEEKLKNMKSPRKGNDVVPVAFLGTRNEL